MISKISITIKNKLNQEYYKNILTVAMGVFFTQFLIVILSPILTRYYSKESFGTIALFLSFVNIFTVISTGRYENAIVLPKDDSRARNLFVFLILLLVGITFIYYVVIFFIGADNLVAWANFESGIWIFSLPLLILLNALFFVARNYLVRNKKYKTTTYAGISKSVVLNIILLIGCVLTPHPIYFLVANILSQLFETVYLIYCIHKEEKNMLADVNTESVKRVLKEYKNFPKYSLPGDLINVYTTQNSTILLASFFSDAIVGLYSITQRVLGIPIKLISGSTLEVYKQKAAEEYAKNKDCSSLFISTLKTLVLMSLLPTIILMAFSPFIFSLVFGEEWIKAGYYARYLSIMFFFQFTCSPLGFTLLIANKQKTNLFWQIGLLILSTIAIYLGYILKSPDMSILLYSIAYSIMYIIYLYLSYKASKRKEI